MELNGWRKARVFVDIMEPGDIENFEVATDVDGNALPRSLEIARLQVVPTASTIRGIRLYGKETRIADPANADYSRNYEDTWGVTPVATDEATYDTTRIIHLDEDKAGNVVTGSIWGQMEIRAAATASAFIIEVHFREKD